MTTYDCYFQKMVSTTIPQGINTMRYLMQQACLQGPSGPEAAYSHGFKANDQYYQMYILQPFITLPGWQKNITNDQIRCLQGHMPFSELRDYRCWNWGDQVVLERSLKFFVYLAITRKMNIIYMFAETSLVHMEMMEIWKTKTQILFLNRGLAYP